MKITKKLNKVKIFLSLSFLFSTTAAFAASLDSLSGCSGTAQLTTLHVFFSCWVIFNMMKYIPDLILVALVVFLSGVVKYVASGDNEESRQAGRQVMIYGIIVFFVMISTWGIVGLIYHSFFPGSNITLPDTLPPLQQNN